MSDEQSTPQTIENEVVKAASSNSLMNQFQDDQPTQQEQQTSQPQSQSYRPEGFPDHLVGSNEKETLDKLFKAYMGARKDISKGIPQAPEKLEDYQLKLDETVMNDLVSDGADESRLNGFKEIALKAKLSEDQFNTVLSEYAKLAKSQIDQDMLMTEEVKQQWLKQSWEELGGVEQAKQTVSAVRNYANALVTKGVISREDLPTYEAMVSEAPFVKLMSKIISHTSEKPINPHNGVSIEGPNIMAWESKYGPEIKDFNSRYWKDESYRTLATQELQKIKINGSDNDDPYAKNFQRITF